MKSIFKCAFGLLALPMFADEYPAPAPPPRAYDYDLFSKDRECEYVDIDALVMKVLNNQQIGSMSQSASQQSASADPGVSERTLNMNNEWKPGFRVTVGYFNAPKYWEVLGQYTWFEDRGSKNVTGGSDGQFLRLGGYQPVADAYNIDANPLIEIAAKSKLFYNDASALVSRNFYPNPHLRLRVVGGLTSVWTHQNTHVQNTFLNVPGTLNYRFDSQYWGVGFKLGLGADWYWGKDFYLTGKVHWSIVTGRWNNNTRVSQSNGTLIYQPFDDSYLAAQNFQFLFGPSYQKSYEKTRLELFVGYEFNAWLGMLTSYNYSRTANAQSWSNPQPFFKDLVLTGVNVRLTLAF